MKLAARTSPGFCLQLAAIAVLVRFALADRMYFMLLHIPSHDMAQGLAFFATSMHSMRLYGDIAWWYPGSITGYAQFYQGLFSPLAPTYGHIVFIAWAELVALLGALGLAIPEYVQYLIVNYLVLPFLAFAAFAWFCSLILRRRASIALALTAYVLSGIGLWHSAWFYFQEAFSLFFLLGASIAVLQRPTPARLFVWLAAILVQLASLNYWTVYNLFLFVSLAGAYAATHRNQCVRLAVRVRRLVRARPRASAAAITAFAVVAIAWTVLIVSALATQSGRYVRYPFKLEDAIAPQIVASARLTIEPFNPSFDQAVGGLAPAIHYARYIGAALLPFLVLGLAAARTRRVRWLLYAAAPVLAVSVAWEPMVWAWSAIPFLDRIKHLFYMYGHHWLVLLVLVAAAGFDAFAGPWSRRGLRWMRGTFTLSVAAAALVIVFVVATAAWGPPRMFAQDGAAIAAALVLLASAAALRAVRSADPRDKRFAVAAILWLMFVDLSGYFWTVTRRDIEFTIGRWTWPTAPPAIQETKPWGPPDPHRGFQAGLDRYMSIHTDFWPVNQYLTPSEVNPDWAQALHAFETTAPPLVFYGRARASPRQDAMPVTYLSDLAGIDRELRVDVAGAGADAGGPPATSGFSYEWRSWRYNEFELDIQAANDGWLMIRQHFDPSWHAWVDGSRVEPVKANYISMAIALPRGSHAIRLEYRPLARTLYWPAAILLELVVLAFLTTAIRRVPRARASPAGTPAGRSRSARR